MVLNVPLSFHILETCSWNQTLLSELQCPCLLNGRRNSICGAVMKLTGESASRPLGTGQGEVQDGSARPGKHLESVGREIHWVSPRTWSPLCSGADLAQLAEGWALGHVWEAGV